MVARLFPITQNPPKDSQKDHNAKEHRQGNPHLPAQHMGHPIAPQHREESSAQMPRQPHGNGQDHKPHQWLDQTNQRKHHLKPSSLLHGATASP